MRESAALQVPTLYWPQPPVGVPKLAKRMLEITPRKRGDERGEKRERVKRRRFFSPTALSFPSPSISSLPSKTLFHTGARHAGEGEVGVLTHEATDDAIRAVARGLVDAHRALHGVNKDFCRHEEEM